MTLRSFSLAMLLSLTLGCSLVTSFDGYSGGGSPPLGPGGDAGSEHVADAGREASAVPKPCSGGDCLCPSGNCSCTGGNCNLTCPAAGDCKLTRLGANGNNTCGAGTCTVQSTGGTVSTTCPAGGTCAVSCTGANCDTTCAAGSTCSTTCFGGTCKVVCDPGATCSCGTSCTCTGPGCS